MSAVIFIDKDGERQWVSSPTNRLTRNPNRAAVIEDGQINGIVSWLRRQTGCKPTVMPYAEFEHRLPAFHNDWVRGGRKSSARMDRIARRLALRFAKAIAAAKEWLGDTKCDLCRKPITGHLYDAVADSARGSWATMCKKCWRQEGAHLGLGKGQEYVETAPGKFELNRGGSGGDRRLKPCRK